jgi:hypothetical protein
MFWIFWWFWCLWPRRCQGEEYDDFCPKGTLNVTDVAVQAVVAREKPISFAKTPGRDPTIGEDPRHLRFFKNMFQPCWKNFKHVGVEHVTHLHHLLISSRRRLFAATVLGTCLHLCPPRRTEYPTQNLNSKHNLDKPQRNFQKYT